MDIIMPYPRKRLTGCQDSPIDLTGPSRKKTTIKLAPVPECVLHSIPFEIREKIFHLSLDWTGKSPPMLVALRPEPELYQQAMVIFRKNNMFTARGLEKSVNMPLEVIQAIERLSLEAGKEYFHPVSFQISNYQPGPNHWKAAQNWTMNLTELRLSVDFDFPKLVYKMSTTSLFTDRLLFPSLNKLVFCNASNNINDSPESGEVTRGITHKLLTHMNQRMGVCAKLESVLEGTELGSGLETFVSVSDVWFWEAPPKKTFARLSWEQGRLPELRPDDAGWRRLTL